MKKLKPVNSKIELRSESMPVIFDAIPYNCLFYFLISNLLPGLVYFSGQTMNVASSMVVVVISAYVFSLHVIAFVLFRLKWHLKFW